MRQRECLGDLERARTHHHQISGPNGNIGSSSDGDTEVSLSKRWGVIDSVADHRITLNEIASWDW
jgi:hypothetical protein